MATIYELMTKSNLYNFIKERKSKIFWRGKELILSMDFSDFKELRKIVSKYLQKEYYYVELKNIKNNRILEVDILPLCEFYKIDMEEFI